jgi:hypothetical protein
MSLPTFLALSTTPTTASDYIPHSAIELFAVRGSIRPVGVNAAALMLSARGGALQGLGQAACFTLPSFLIAGSSGRRAS